MWLHVSLLMSVPQGQVYVYGIPSEQYHPVLGLAGLGI